MRKTLTIGLVQMACAAERDANRSTLSVGVRECAAQGAELVVLPELHDLRYFCQTEHTGYFDLAEPIPGPTTEQLGRLAEALGIVIVGSVFERRAGGLYHDTAVVLERDGTLAGHYRKMHIPDDPGYHEKFYFAPGDQGFLPVDTSVGTLGVMICWDQWYPEAARLMALAGAELLIFPSAIGWDPQDDAPEQRRQLESWLAIQRGHAVANGLPLATCNRTGLEPDPSGSHAGIQFWGNSFVVGPQGEMLRHATASEQGGIIVQIDLTRSEQVRRTWPFLRDRRIDAYAGLTKRFIG